MKDATQYNCQTDCIDPDNPVYYEKSDQVIKTWGNPRNPFTNTVNIVYYNTETQFVLEVMSSLGWSDLVIDGVSVWTGDPVPANEWGVYTEDLPADWAACDSRHFSLLVSGNGPPPTFNVEYQYFGICQDETVTDIDGNVYPTVVIGNQVWMAENLKVTHYNDGNPIPNITDAMDWKNTRSGAYCWSNNDISYKDVYGALYNWYTVETGKLCPAGFHVPTRDEWITLVDYLGGSEVAGGKLKSTSELWYEPNTCATDEYGFAALPGGYRGGGFSTTTFCPFGELEKRALFWTSTTGDWSGEAYHNQLIYNYCSTSITTYNRAYYKNAGESVRCIKD